MVSSWKIENAKIFWHGSLVEGGLCSYNGKITAIGKGPTLPETDRTIDAHGMLCLPGMVDVHVHLRDLELSYKEDFTSGTSAAAAGGYTTIVDMPNTKPVTDSIVRLDEKIRIASSKILVNVGFNVVPSSVDEMTRTSDKAIAFKFNLVTPWSQLSMSEETISLVIKKAGELGKITLFHAEDGHVVDELEAKFRNDTSVEAYYKAHPDEAEEESVRRILGCMSAGEGHVHVCHLSTLGGLSMIRQARDSGLKVSCEVTGHHVLLESESASQMGGIAIMDPPLRKRRVALALYDALVSGYIDLVASDHAPHALSEKTHSEWWRILPGIPGLETTLPLFLTQVNMSRMTLGQMVDLLSTNPSDLLGLKKGRIEMGADADVVLVDLTRKTKIDCSRFFSKAKYSPFEGMNVVGCPMKTFVCGELVYDEGDIVSNPGIGHILEPRSSTKSPL